MTKILVTGGSGLLGSNISKIATSRYEVFATYNKNKVSMDNVSYFQADLSIKGDLEEIEQIKPEFIIHCAALTNMDFCEENPADAYNGNVLASIHVAEVARKIGSYLIYISTDSVFNGEDGNYSESDIPDPISVYGKTKLEAEQKVLSICPHSCVVRTNIYGWNKLNKFSLAEWMLNKLTNNEELPGIKDVYFSPTLVNDLAGILFKLYEGRNEGIFHIVGGESCSKLDFAYNIAEVFRLDKSVIKPINFQALGLKAPRGMNMSLNVTKVREILKVDLPHVREGLEEMRMLRNEGYVESLKHGKPEDYGYHPCSK